MIIHEDNIEMAVRQKIIWAMKNKKDPALNEIFHLDYIDESRIDEIAKIASQIATEATQNPNLNITEICVSIGIEIPSAWYIENNLDMYRDPLYQALVWYLRCLDKTDYHVHFSRNVHETKIVAMITKARKRNKAIFDLIIQDLCRHRPKFDEDLVDNPEEFARYLRKEKILEDNKTDAFFIKDLITLRESAKIGCLKFLLDGTTSFDMRFNPAKKELFAKYRNKKVLTQEEWRDVIKKTTKALRKGLDQGIAEAKKVGITAKKVGTIFSFSRAKDDYLCVGKSLPVQKMAEIAIAVCGNEIAGVDISGPEYHITEYESKFLSWKECINKYPNMSFMSHIDLRNTRLSPGFKSILKNADACLDKNNIPGFYDQVTKFLEGYIPFAKESLKILPYKSRIAHAYILDPNLLCSSFWGHINEKGQANNITWLDWAEIVKYTGVTGKRLKDEADDLIDMVCREGHIIETNPQATVRNSQDLYHYGLISLYRWLENGTKVVLGTDAGVFSFNRPRNFSELGADLLLTHPINGRSLTFKDLCEMM